MKNFIVSIFFFSSFFTGYSQICIDTSYKLTFKKVEGSLVNHVIRSDKHGNCYFAGKYIDRLTNSFCYYVTKLNDVGAILWSQRFNTSANEVALGTLNNIIEFSNGDIILSARKTSKELQLFKFSTNGILLWKKIISGLESEDFNSANLQVLDNSIYISAYTIPDLGPNAGEFLNTLIKLDANGNQIWSKFYSNPSCKSFYSLGIVDISQNSMVLWGRNIPYSYCNAIVNNETESSYFSVKLNKADGQIIDSRSYINTKEFGNNSGIGNSYSDFFSSNKLGPNSFVFTNYFRNNENNENGICRISFDTNLNVHQSILYASNIHSTSSIRRYKGSIDEDGSTNIISYNSAINGSDPNFYIIKIDSASNIVRQKRLSPTDNEYLFSTGKNPLDIKRNYLSLMINSKVADTGTIQLFQLNNDEKKSDCFGEDFSFIDVKPFTFEPYTQQHISESTDIPLSITEEPVTSLNFELTSDLNCKIISTCNAVTIEKSKDTICNINSIYSFKANLNPSCYKKVFWKIDSSAVEYILAINDTTVQIKFKKKWTGYLYASINSCKGIVDSILLNIFQSPVSINLGIDTNTCINDTIQLNAGPGFKNYLWQDGSTDSILNVSQTGQYFVSATDYCDNIFTDTINITVRPVLPIILPNDTSICSNSHILLDAGPGFSSYSWSTGENIASIKVNQSGQYSILAQDNFGCYSRDTFNLINLLAIPILNFPNKNIYCQNQADTIKLSGSYTSVLWQNQSNNLVMPIKDTGWYKVIVGNNAGCFNSDSVYVKKIITPILNFLPTDSTVCVGEYLMPTIPFNEYVWNNGLTSNSIQTNIPGLYFLNVKDNFGCKHSDSSIITHCPETIYFPNSFTPNNDGLNDIFRPAVSRRLAYYKLAIFNRYGQKIFETNNPDAGWNGLFKSQPQQTATYIWQCSYRFANKPTKNIKGTLLLLR